MIETDAKMPAFLSLLGLWALLALCVGAIGIAFGPGIVMLFLSAIWAFLGFTLFYLRGKAIPRLRLLYAGALHAALSAGLLAVAFGEGSSTLQAFLWLLSFFALPSYLGGYASSLLFRLHWRRRARQ